MSKIFTPNFRVAFPQVFEPKSINGGKPKYSITMIFDMDKINKNAEQKDKWDKMVASIEETAIGKWSPVPAVLKKPFKKGDDQRNKETGDVYNGFEGMVTVNALSETRPGLLGPDANPIMQQSEFYGGCYARATINAYAWQHPQSGKGVSFGLQNIQKVDDGETFGGKSKAEDDFGAISTPAAASAAGNATDLFDE